MIKKNDLIIAQDHYYEMDGYKIKAMNPKGNLYRKYKEYLEKKI